MYAVCGVECYKGKSACCQEVKVTVEKIEG
jgi:hypothetical protein